MFPGLAKPCLEPRRVEHAEMPPRTPKVSNRQVRWSGAGAAIVGRTHTRGADTQFEFGLIATPDLCWSADHSHFVQRELGNGAASGFHIGGEMRGIHMGLP